MLTGKMEKSWIIVVISIAAFVSVDSLQCYSCYDCPATKLKDSDLVTCGASDTTTTSTTTTTTTASPVSPGTNNTEPGTNTTIPGTNSTESGTGGTGTNGTESGGTNSSSLDAGEFQITRLRRDVHSSVGCTCFGLECDCREEGAVSRASLYANVTYVCVKGTVKDANGTTVIVRDCAHSTICEDAAAANITTDCHTCSTDKCNGAYKTQGPVFSLLSVLTLLFVNKH